MTQLKKKNGQTIIEAMLSISMLTIGFLGILTLLSKSFFLTRVTSDDLTATYLASEGIEIAKNITDHDVYARLATPPQGTGWGSVWGLAAGGTRTFEVDYKTCTGGAVCAAQPTANRNLGYDPVTHYYSYTGSQVTNFKRELVVSLPAALNGNEIVVRSIVTWSTGPLTNENVTLEDHFYNWHP